MKAFGIVGWSGSGKTTLIEALLPRLAATGLRVSVVKQSHHDVEIDRPGKDSWRHRQAGAQEVILASPQRWALMHELRGAAEPALDDLLTRLAPCDLVLVEGFKREPHPKLEVWRAALGKPWLHPDDPHVLAVAADAAPPSGLRRFDLDDPAAIGRFIMEAMELG